jgi:hypothetical protein
MSLQCAKGLIPRLARPRRRHRRSIHGHRRHEIDGPGAAQPAGLGTIA